MNSVERFKIVLDGGIPDRVPFFEMALGPSHLRAALGAGAGNWKSFDDLPADRYAAVLEKTGIDLFYHVFLWKVGRIYRADSDGILHYVDGSIRDRPQFSRIKEPDVGPSIRRLMELAAAQRAGHRYPIIIGVSGPYKLAKAAIGYEEFLLRSHDDPEFILELMEILGSRELAALKQLLPYGVAAVLLPADTCMNTGPMMSRDSLKKLWLEPTRQYTACLRELSIPLILHIDGDFSPIMDMVMDLQPAAIHPFEVCGNLSIFEAKRSIGDRVTLIGNIDLSRVLSAGRPGDVEAAVEDHMRRLAPGGRYMCGSSHEISEAVPVENFHALCRAVRKFGSY